MLPKHKYFDIAVVGTGTARGVSLERCWTVIEDSEKYQDWVSALSKSELLVPGKDSRNGVGSLRKFYNNEGGNTIEIVNIHHRPYVYGYRVYDPEARFKDHQGVVSLREVPRGVGITWCITANMSGPRSLDETTMQRVVDITVRGLVSACEAVAGGF